MFKNIHAFVGSVALAGAQDGLWAIEGGNWKLVEKLLEASKVDFVEAKVRKKESLKLHQKISTTLKNQTKVFTFFKESKSKSRCLISGFQRFPDQDWRVFA
jgi:hypothetical protein